MIINIPFLCFPTSLQGWQFKYDSFLVTFSVFHQFISIRIHIFNLILLPYSFAFESVVYFSLQYDQFCQAHLPLKNNLFHFSSAYILSSFSVSSFLVCIYFSSFFFFFFCIISSVNQYYQYAFIHYYFPKECKLHEIELSDLNLFCCL